MILQVPAFSLFSLCQIFKSIHMRKINTFLIVLSIILFSACSSQQSEIDEAEEAEAIEEAVEEAINEAQEEFQAEETNQDKDTDAVNE
jgi:uncharacterized lipoprotein YajG